MKKVQHFEDLIIFQKSYQLALEIYKMTLKFPKETQFDLTDQMRRASKSIPTNIAEGFGRRKSQKEFARFIRVSIGSKDEMLVHLSFVKDLGFISTEKYQKFAEE